MDKPQPSFAAELCGQTSDFVLGVPQFTFADLFDAKRLAELEAFFLVELTLAQSDVACQLKSWRAGTVLDAKSEADLLVAVAGPLGDLIARLFAIQDHTQALKDEQLRNQEILAFKREFIDKRVRRRAVAEVGPLDDVTSGRLTDAWAQQNSSDPPDEELSCARVALRLLGLWQVIDQRPAPSTKALQAVRIQLSAAVGRDVPADELRATVQTLLGGLEAWHRQRLPEDAFVAYHQPARIDSTHLDLVPKERDAKGAWVGPAAKRSERQGFGLTDTRMGQREAAAETDYCLVCHPRSKDSCRTGLKERDGSFKKTPLGIVQDGCPLDERISEAHLLRERGQIIAALAMIMRDNPMVPGTGHRICNDCMRACIFQKQQPVDIPQVETNTLTQVLKLPYGVEIYGLLTRFNPLRRDRSVPVPLHGHKVLVVGLGPAGYTLAHYLLQEGFGVVAIDGLKLEPLPDSWTGKSSWPPRPIVDYAEIEEALDERAAAGFGGVAEYGITVRWDKNFLRLMYLTLARTTHFAAIGGIRFGGTVTLEDAWAQGFDHVALAAGAGKPTIVGLKNNMMRGMRTASDFLMALQLTGAARRGSLANLQVELPAVVIGGGLTAVDTATEIAAYYPLQITRLARQVEDLGRQEVEAKLDDEERVTLARMLAHAQELADERRKRVPDVAGLVQRWGGVTVAYRRGLSDAPAYRLNHEEVHKALAEGVRFLEHVTPQQAVPDAYGHVAGLQVQNAAGELQILPARSVMMAAGTTPNTIYAREVPGSLKLDARGRFFATHQVENALTGTLKPCSPHEPGAFFTSYKAPATDDTHGLLKEPTKKYGAAKPARLVSFFGDNHPRYAGNVVRAMASAKEGHVHIAQLFAASVAQTQAMGVDAALPAWRSWLNELKTQWEAEVVAVKRLGPGIIEVEVLAPTAARKFAPGQFFRLQNFERDALRIGDVSLTMEGLALTGAWVDPQRGTLGLIALEMGVSSRLCGQLQPKQKVVLMGPTGAPTDIPYKQNVILCGGGLGNAVLFSVARAMRANGCRIIYFAGYRSAETIFKREEVEAAADQVVWSVNTGEAPKVSRASDRAFVGNIVEAMVAMAEGRLGAPVVPLSSVQHVLAIGSDRMMAAIAHARTTVLKPYLNSSHTAVASINSPMQCMLKEVCAQCLQRHVDPVTLKESYVFSCFNQDQPQDSMDWQNLAARLRQNTLLEKVTGLTLARMMNNLSHRADL